MTAPDDLAGERYAALAADALAALPAPAGGRQRRWDQARQALLFLECHLSLPDLVERAAVVLMAPPGAPVAESSYGGRADPLMSGRRVTCTACRRTWTAQPEDPYLHPGGICTACLLLAGSRIPEAEPVLAGVIVPPGEDTADERTDNPPARRPARPRGRPRGAAGHDPARD